MGEPRTALLVIDLQRDVVAACERTAGVIAVVGGLIARARSAAVPVIFVQHEDADLVPGRPGWQLVDELDVRAEDRVVTKQYRDAFADTELEQILHEGGIERVVVTGTQSDYCVHTSAVSAVARGFDLTLVADGHTTGDSGTGLPAASIVEFVNARTATLRYPGRTVDVVPGDRLWPSS